jgi:hypothetical protein
MLGSRISRAEPDAVPVATTIEDGNCPVPSPKRTAAVFSRKLV